MQESEIFFAVMSEPSLDQRTVVLQRLCGDDQKLRDRIQSLIQAAERAPQEFMKDAAMDLEKTIIGSPDNLSGTKIGGYKLLQKIGEGGFGDVYMAEQTEPVRRTVALKLIKPGMDSREVIARFESERQALALMEHPNIAQVLDAGTTPTGQPFFVMELVRGVPITEFCDKNRFSSNERLKLFLSVCHAVQHAHHKGVIHRDIKPSNVMVTLHDGVPVVKVIDFGVAKATAQKLTEKTLFTAYGQMIGTPAYMSPEQAEMSGLDIDTRSDIYSLGVLLYELLTGSTPLDVKRLRAAGLLQLQKMISEEAAQRPSLRVSSLGEEATILAGNRGTDVKRLTASLQGDLDWIVMKALEKDRNRRYGTPNSLAADLDRFLKGDAIEARPPSMSYRLQRLLSRHRTLVTTSACIALGLLAATVISIGMAMRAMRAEQVAEQKRGEAEKAQEELQTALAETQLAQQKAEKLTAQVALSSVTLDFNDITLLKLANHLTQISDENSDYKDFIKLNILGALNYVAANGKGGESESWMDSRTWEEKLLQPASPSIHTFEEGVFVYSNQPNKCDLTAVDMGTGKQLLDISTVSDDGSSVHSVFVNSDLLVVLDDKARLRGISRITGKEQYVTPLPDEIMNDASNGFEHLLDGYAGMNAILDKRRTRLVTTKPSTTDSDQRQELVAVDLLKGGLVKIPVVVSKDSELILALSDDGLKIAAIQEGGLLSVWDSRDGRNTFHGPVSEQIITAMTFRPGGKFIVFGASTGADSGTSVLTLWDCQSHKSISSWEKRGAVGAMRFITLNVLTDGAETWILDETTAATSVDGHQPATFHLRNIEEPVLFADEEWLVTSEGKVYSRQTLKAVAAASGRRYPEQLKRFSASERFWFSAGAIVDLKLDTAFPGEYWDNFEYDPSSGYIRCGVNGYCDMVLPADPQSVPADVLQSLVELFACGELDSHGEFVPWTEETWNTRKAESSRTGFLSLPMSQSLSEFLRQPAFWARNRVAQASREGSGEAIDDQRKSWDYLLSIDDTAFNQLAYLNYKVEEEQVSDIDRLTQEVSLARRYRDEFWEARFEHDHHTPADTLALDESLTEQQLAVLNEWFDLRSQYQLKKGKAIGPGKVSLAVNEDGVPTIESITAIEPADVFYESYALFRGGRSGEALTHLNAATKSIPAGPAGEIPEAAVIPVEDAVRLLVLKSTIEAQQLQSEQLEVTIQQLLRQLELPADRRQDLCPKLKAGVEIYFIPQPLLLTWESGCVAMLSQQPPEN